MGIHPRQNSNLLLNPNLQFKHILQLKLAIIKFKLSICQFKHSNYSAIGHFGKYHNTLCLSPQILHKHCVTFLLGLTMVPRENKNNAYAKFGGTNKEYYGIFRSGLFNRSIWRFKHSVRRFKHSVLQFKPSICQFKPSICPFKHSIWQFNRSIQQFKHSIPQFKHLVVNRNL